MISVCIILIADIKTYYLILQNTHHYLCLNIIINYYLFYCNMHLYICIIFTAYLSPCPIRIMLSTFFLAYKVFKISYIVKDSKYIIGFLIPIIIFKNKSEFISLLKLLGVYIPKKWNTFETKVYMI